MADLRFMKLPDGKAFIDEHTLKKEVIQKDKFKEARDAKEAERIKRIGKLPPFGDADGDKIPNVFDKRPFKKDKRSKWGLLLR